MPRHNQKRIFAADFETTVYDGQEFTEVWSAAIVEINTEDVKIFHGIDELFRWLEDLDTNSLVYFHNLKFDGEFIISYYLMVRGFENAGIGDDPEADDFRWRKRSTMKKDTFEYSISNMGQWYTMLIRAGDRYIEIRDSLKLLPFSLAKLGKDFQTPHQKTEMEYKGRRYAGCEITPEELEYIRNDVLVLKEALEISFAEGHDRLTIGACCLSEYKASIGFYKYHEWHPNLYELELSPEFGTRTAGDYIRRSYRGGWCYLVPGKKLRHLGPGFTADVNSLYPSMMSSASGNVYPVGRPTFWRGNHIPDEARRPDRYFFIRVRCAFRVKPGRLPCIQIKNTYMYNGQEQLETSELRDPRGNKYSWVRELNGEVHRVRPEMTWTQTDYELYREQYDFEDFEILDGCFFEARIGLFDPYMDKYRRIKQESKGARRAISKLMLNNLYGKMSASQDSSFKVGRLDDEDLIVKYRTVTAHDKTPGYIAIGSAITSYSRAFTIRAAQKNYYGPDKPGFAYADTDSIHCDLPPEQVRGIKVHPSSFCAWKLESYWGNAWFVRAKTYWEYVTHEDGEPVKRPYYNMKCAGLPDKCKDLFLASCGVAEPPDKMSDMEREFYEAAHTLDDFRPGLAVPGKLMPKRLPGGVILADTEFVIRK